MANSPEHKPPQSAALDFIRGGGIAGGVDSYDDIFALRGSAYDGAMQACPDARSQEFRQAIDRAQLKPGMVVADVPAGGGYMQRYLPADCQWLPHEPCTTFTSHHAPPDDPGNGQLLPLPWADTSIDTAISIAGVHHLEDKKPLLAELFRVVRPGGCLVLSDVAAGSPPALFLDDYVGTFNSTGHDGIFLDEQILQDFDSTGWDVELHEPVDLLWHFPDTAVMAQFCHRLFDLQRSTPADTEAAIARMLGFEATAEGLGMHWALTTIRARRRGGAA